MSTNIQLEKTCEYCGNAFIAKTTVTRYCSHKCNQRHYKQLKKEEKLSKAKQAERKNTTPPIEPPVDKVQQRDYLSITQTCVLLGIGRTTLYKIINDQQLKVRKLGNRTIIKRSEIDKIFI